MSKWSQIRGNVHKDYSYGKLIMRRQIYALGCIIPKGEWGKECGNPSSLKNINLHRAYPPAQFCGDKVLAKGLIQTLDRKSWPYFPTTILTHSLLSLCHDNLVSAILLAPH